MAKKKNTNKPTKSPQPENRKSERRSTNITAVVHFRESSDESWKEISEINTFSKNGAGVVVSRECPVGRIVSLVIQMPRELRAYDFDEEVYPILGVVQNCWRSTINEQSVFHVGCAFIGKKYPDSYKADPTQCYRIIGMTDEGLWAVSETAAPFKARRYSRFWRRIEITISIRDQLSRTTNRKNVFSREISAGGLSVWGALDVEIGERVKISSKQHDYYSMAIVTNQTVDVDDPTQSTTHFELLDSLFPIEKLFEAAPPSKTEATEEVVTQTAPAQVEEVKGGVEPNDCEIERFS